MLFIEPNEAWEIASYRYEDNKLIILSVCYMVGKNQSQSREIVIHDVNIDFVVFMDWIIRSTSRNYLTLHDIKEFIVLSTIKKED